MTRPRPTSRHLLPSLLLLSPLALPQSTLLVPEQHASIQAAIGAAADGDTVLVSPGTYRENVDFLGKDITLRGRHGAAVTTIDGGLAGPVVRMVSGESRLAVLEGFTLTNGYSTYGGGIRCVGSDPTIRYCVVSDNDTDGDGAGFYLGSCTALVQSCVVRDNLAGFYGSGIFADQGAPVVVNCTVYGNESLDDWNEAAGISCWSSAVLVANTISWDNELVWGNTGDLYLPPPARAVHCVFSEATGADGNMAVDPQFVSTEDLHLVPGSPCVDRGRVNLPGAPPFDFESDPRFVGLAPDIGADELAPHFYHVGDAAPGATIELRVIGVAPGTACSAWLSAGLAPSPIPTPQGLFFLADRRVVLFEDRPVPASGLLQVPYTLPPSVPTPVPLFAQALLGSSLSNYESLLVD